MTIRESLEQWEKEYLSPYAALSMHSKGRLKEEEPCDIRPFFNGTETGSFTARPFAG